MFSWPAAQPAAVRRGRGRVSRLLTLGRSLGQREQGLDQPHARRQPGAHGLGDQRGPQPGPGLCPPLRPGGGMPHPAPGTARTDSSPGLPECSPRRRTAAAPRRPPCRSATTRRSFAAMPICWRLPTALQSTAPADSACTVRPAPARPPLPAGWLPGSAWCCTPTGVQTCSTGSSAARSRTLPGPFSRPRTRTRSCSSTRWTAFSRTGGGPATPGR